MLAQCRSLTDAQLSTCRVTPEQDYALEDVLAALFPSRPENQALLEALHADPISFANLGLCIKRSSWNDATVYVAPLADALKFADTSPSVRKPVAAGPSALITEAELKSVCRVTPEGKISVYDALVWRDDCKPNNACTKYQQWIKKSAATAYPTYRFQHHHPPTPIASFQEILQLFSEIPGAGAAKFRSTEEHSSPETRLRSNPKASATLPQNITEEDLKNACRATPDGRLSVYDALAFRDNSSHSNAAKRYRRFLDHGLPAGSADEPKTSPHQKFQFGFDRQATPVAHFDEIMQLFSLVPGPGAAKFRSQQFELVRSLYRDGLAVPPNPVAAVPTVNEANEQESKEQEEPSRGASKDFVKPQDTIVAMQDLEEDLREVCRVTPDDLISVYDALAYRDDTSVSNSSRRFLRFREYHSPDNSDQSEAELFQTFRFGYGAPTPVASFKKIVQLFSLVPGPGAAAYRSQQAELVCGVYQEDLPDFEAPQNPVAAMSLMKVSEEDLKGVCRVTLEGRISVYDALAHRDGSSTRHAAKRFKRFVETASPTFYAAAPIFGTGTNSVHGIPKPLQTFSFGSEQPTPVAYFHEIMELFALIPGPGAATYRAQQAQLSTRAMAGDLDLERAVHDRRAALPASAQEVMLAGLESSEDAKRMRAEQFESEQRAKKPRVSYTGEQLVDMVKGLTTVAPNPGVLSEMWEQCEGVHTAFMAEYVKYCEVRISFSLSLFL